MSWYDDTVCQRDGEHLSPSFLLSQALVETWDDPF